MRRVLYSLIAIAGISALCLEQDPAAPQTGAAAPQGTTQAAGNQAGATNQIAAGTVIPADLAKSVDARKSNRLPEAAMSQCLKTRVQCPLLAALQLVVAAAWEHRGGRLRRNRQVPPTARETQAVPIRARPDRQQARSVLVVRELSECR